MLSACADLRVRYIYDSWGNTISIQNGNGQELTGPNDIGNLNPFRYRGYYLDSETGLYYLQSRYYDPQTCRFVNGDGVVSGIGDSVQGYNIFAYCFNNPVSLSDSSGNWPFFAVTAIVGAVVGAVVGGVTAAKTGGNVWAGIGVGAAAGALIGSGVGMAAGAALAGSITATTGAVMAGGSLLVSTVATGGFSAGATYIANNFQQAGTQIVKTFTTISQKFVPKTPSKVPSNPGKPFELGKTGFQYGVNPNTLIPSRSSRRLGTAPTDRICG